MDSPSKTFSPCQATALERLQNTRDNLFVTGYAGSGKSYLLQHFLKGKDRKLWPLVASTGAAAVLIGGRTFHSFFGLGILEGGPVATIDKALGDRRLVKRLRDMEGFVLDEVSMISGPTLAVAEEICRRARGEPLRPWGGARAIVVGDFAQLPPVNRHGEAKAWAFLDPVWERSHFVTMALKSVLRSEDPEYLRVLHFVREGEVNDEVRSYLDRRVDEDLQENRATHLFPHRATADRLNLQRLAEIEAPLQSFPTQYTGNVMAVAALKRQAPIGELLQLKLGAWVMIRINDPQWRYVNGTTGRVQAFEAECLVIELRNGRMVELKPTAFSLLDAQGQVMATAMNFPVTLAYATTIHKAQGATLEKMVCDLRQLWEPGQAYVALSRLRSGQGLSLVGWDEGSIKVDAQVREFYRGMEET